MTPINRVSVYLLILVLNTYACNSQKLNQKVTDAEGTEKLLGQVNKDAFAKWFNSQYEVYKVDVDAISAVSKELKDFEIKLFLGTWCGDSKREVPRFYKILEKADFPIDQLVTVAVDNEKPNYKKSPGGEEKGLNIIKVPTFIFYKQGVEVNRIVESPIESLEKDIRAIVAGEKYIPNYSKTTTVPQIPLD